jgi:putative endonuclease
MWPHIIQINIYWGLIMQAYVYILTNKKHGTLYTGVTNNLIRRIYEHKQKEGAQFTTRYQINKLVYYDIFADICSAIQREKQIKHWKRQWKINLIENQNPDWIDLYTSIIC